MDQPEKENNLSPALLKTDSILFNRITDYYEAHITEHIKVEHLCKEFAIGRSHFTKNIQRTDRLWCHRILLPDEDQCRETLYS